MDGLPKILIAAGILLAAVGILMAVGQDRLGWFGRLPGDIRIERPGFRLYFPFTTLILVSVMLNVILWLVFRFRR